jgi:hypothetical protein
MRLSSSALARRVLLGPLETLRLHARDLFLRVRRARGEPPPSRSLGYRRS